MTMRIGKALAKGYLAADFREALQRYFTRTQPAAEPEAYSAEAFGANLHVSQAKAEEADPPSSDTGATRDGRKGPEGGDRGAEPGGAVDDHEAAA